MTSRWGVCHMAKRQITFALQLYNMPEAAQIYVVVHEYCHFLQPNHSPAFWAEVAKLMPDWEGPAGLIKRITALPSPSPSVTPLPKGEAKRLPLWGSWQTRKGLTERASQ